MRRSWASLTVGVLVVIVAGLSYWLIRSTSDRTHDQGYAVWALFHNAGGLFEKSRVVTAGISVGQIEKRELDKGTAQARITIRIAPDIVLYENALVAKKSASLLGEYFLEIDPGTPRKKEADDQIREMRKLKDGDQIKFVTEPVELGEMMASMGTLIPVMRQILDDVHKLTSGPISDIANNVDDMIERNSEKLESLLTRVDHIAGTIDTITTAEAGDVKESIKNVREITESIKALVGTTHEQIAKTGEGARGSIDKLQGSIDNLEKTMKNMETVTTRIEKGEGTVGRLVSDDTIARNVEEITEDAGGFIKSITRLQTIVGLRTEYNFLTSTFKNYLAVTLMPRPDKFYLIELVEDPRGYRTKTVTVVDNSSQPGPQSETRVTLTEQLRFTLQFGKRVGIRPNVAIGGRFGIKESTGGIAGDLYLFHDRLLLSVDVFDAKANRYPRIKATMSYAIWQRNLFVVAGADDMANYERSTGGGALFDYFAGMQLVFNDEDLRALLLFGGGAAAGAASK